MGLPSTATKSSFASHVGFEYFGTLNIKFSSSHHTSTAEDLSLAKEEAQIEALIAENSELDRARLRLEAEIAEANYQVEETRMKIKAYKRSTTIKYSKSLRERALCKSKTANKDCSRVLPVITKEKQPHKRIPLRTQP